MRALCGAIITAGALLGLGMTAIGIGTRYTREHDWGPVAADDAKGGEKADAKGDAKGDGKRKDVQPYIVYFREMDTPLLFLVIFLTSAALVGMGIAILGLAYHHARREREWSWEREQAAARQRTAV